jgi:hypothetical protein|tara:strand:- start:236 stop:643 length:408 start_codon:yes stop_codon:yes gene_type:complete
MADVVAFQKLQDGDKTAVMKFTNISDGTGEAAVTKVNVDDDLQSQSGSGAACTGVSIQQIYYELKDGMTVDILWHATTNVLAWTLSGYGYFDFRSCGPLINNAAASGKTGDIKFTTTASSGDRYSIMLKMGKSYE